MTLLAIIVGATCWRGEMTQKHSPGPWTLERKNGKVTALRDANGEVIADFGDGWHGAYPEEGDAEAMRAAPEMLALLREAEGALQRGWPLGTAERIRNLLKRLEGT